MNETDFTLFHVECRVKIIVITRYCKTLQKSENISEYEKPINKYVNDQTSGGVKNSGNPDGKF